MKKNRTESRGPMQPSELLVSLGKPIVAHAHTIKREERRRWSRSVSWVISLSVLLRSTNQDVILHLGERAREHDKRDLLLFPV
jgi:hypothetical protein